MLSYMIKRVFGVFFSLILASVAMPVFAETIDVFHVDAKLESNRMFTVTETIIYDFEGQYRHGIYRLIPERYARSGATYRLHLNVLGATLDGKAVQTKVTTEASNIRIRLGDPDEIITGKHTYTISYQTNRAVNDFPDEGESELYWNITGNGWDVPIEKASMTLVGPVAPSQTVCFTGFAGSTAHECKIMEEKNHGIQAEATRTLYSGEGLTVALRFPGDSFQSISIWQKILNFLADNIWAFIPVVTFVGMFIIWWLFGKEPRATGTVIAQYEAPEGLEPGLMAALIEQRVSLRAITATILDFGRRGYLKVVFQGGETDQTGWFKKKPKFTLKKLREPTGLLPYEREIFEGLFESDEVDISEADYQLAAAITEARKKIFEELRKRKLFGKNPSAIRSAWLIGAFTALVFAMPFLIDYYGPLTLLGLAMSAVIVAIFGWNMPRMTKTGALMRERIEGFKLFLSVTEKDRVKFHDAPERRPEQFGEFLPAAVAFGVEEQWAKHFEGLDVHPTYLEGQTQGWSAASYVSTVDSFHRSSSSTMYRTQSSGGSGGSGFSSGGSSGGGFGGGGGGSW